MLPLTLGSNVGTCVTSLLAALVTEGTDALQVALAHLFFNLTGILIWYPIPFLRRIPLDLARKMGKATRLWKGFPIVYIIVAFIGIPLGLLGTSNLFGRNQTLTVIGSVIVVAIAMVIGGCAYWLNWKGGRKNLGDFLKRRQKNTNAMETLPYDVHYVERRIQELQRHTLCSPNTTTEGNRLVDVSADMEYALEKVERLARHTGLPVKEDMENLGRFWQKEMESMNDVDIPEFRWHVIILESRSFILVILGLIISSLLVWGLVVLFSNGSTGYTAMGGLISSVLVLALLDRIRVYVLGKDGKANRLASYKDRKLREIYTKNYGSKMSQIKADLKQLESHTKFEAAHSKNETTSSATESSE